MRLASIQVGKPKIFDDESGFRPDHSWSSAILKETVDAPVWLGALNLEGDRQDDLKVHGGPDQSILGYCAEHYPVWRVELERPDFPFGGFGENFTIEGLDEDSVSIGDTFEIGDAVIQVTSPAAPAGRSLAGMASQPSPLGWRS